MRAYGTIIASCVVLANFPWGVFQPSLEASQAVLTEADFSAAMEEIDYVTGDAELHIDAKYWGDLGTDTDALKSLLEQIQKFWMAREVQGAVDFVEQAQQKWPDLKIVYTSGYPDRGRPELRSDGAVNFIPKPYRKAELAKTFQELLWP